MMKALNPEHVVPGHGTPGTAKIFEDGEGYYKLLLDRVGAMVKAGKSLDDIKKEVRMPEYASWGSQDRFPTNIEAAYKSPAWACVLLTPARKVSCWSSAIQAAAHHPRVPSVPTRAASRVMTPDQGARVARTDRSSETLHFPPPILAQCPNCNSQSTFFSRRCSATHYRHD
jgi:hypothetical protein